MKVLILTKSLLAETTFQSKLQQLNHEVFCSTCLLNDCFSQEQQTIQLFSLFDLVIISETIAYLEFVEIMRSIRDHAPVIVRKYESEFTRGYEEEQDYVVDQWIKGTASLEEIRELCQTINPQDGRNKSALDFSKSLAKKYHFYNFGLSKRENLLLMCLYENKGDYLSRDELCEKVWSEEGTTSSKMSALSSCVRNIKLKVGKSGIDCDPINTSWGKGYQISDEFYHLIDTEEDYTKKWK